MTVEAAMKEGDLISHWQSIENDSDVEIGLVIQKFENGSIIVLWPYGDKPIMYDQWDAARYKIVKEDL